MAEKSIIDEIAREPFDGTMNMRGAQASHHVIAENALELNTGLSARRGYGSIGCLTDPDFLNDDKRSQGCGTSGVQREALPQ